MLPLVAIIGRPNVGKSALFNCLTRSRAALTAATPGMTRDRRYGVVREGEKHFILTDTCGVEDVYDIASGGARQTQIALEEAAWVIFVVDARDGPTVMDEEIAQWLRRKNQQVLLVVNKIDGLQEESVLLENTCFGFDTPIGVSAIHRQGIKKLHNTLCELLPEIDRQTVTETQSIRLAIAGRPNVGKSTLTNYLLGEQRMVVEDRPGTTRDTIHVNFNYGGCDFELADTAGVHRRSRSRTEVAALTMIRSLRTIEDSHGVLFLIDANQGIEAQDMRLLKFIHDSGRALVIGINKSDQLNTIARHRLQQTFKRRLRFVNYAETYFISATTGKGIKEMMAAFKRAWQSANVQVTDRQLTQIMQEAVECRTPMQVRGRRIKLRFAHVGGKNPLKIVIHGNQTHLLPQNYQRYLERFFQQSLRLHGTRVKLRFISNTNPYVKASPTYSKTTKMTS